MQATEEAATTGAAAATGRGASKRGVPAHDPAAPAGPTTRGLEKRAKQTVVDGAEATAAKATPLIEQLRPLGADFLDIMEAKGAHGIRDHVGQTPQDLIRRCKLSARSGKRRDLIEAATSFPNKHTANMAVKENLIHNVDAITQWLARPGEKHGVFLHQHDHTIGFGTTRLAPAMQYDLSISRVILEVDTTSPLGFKLITTFPVIK